MTAKPTPKQLKKVNGTGPGSDDDFTYTSDSGQTLTIASLAKAFRTAGEIRKARNMAPLDVAMTIVERDCTPEELAVFDAMSFEEFTERFSTQWAEHSGVDLGE